MLNTAHSRDSKMISAPKSSLTREKKQQMEKQVWWYPEKLQRDCSTLDLKSSKTRSNSKVPGAGLSFTVLFLIF